MRPTRPSQTRGQAGPKGVYQHSDGRPMLGRKIAGKTQCELRDLGLLFEPEPAEAIPA